MAAAAARKSARRTRENENDHMVDWAAPAVWSTVVGPMPPRGAAIPPDFVAAKLTRASADDPNIARGAPKAQIDEEQPSYKREPIDIPRFLNRQNNQ